MSHAWGSDHYLQLSNMTRSDRFPKVFETAKSLCRKPKRIMSFGCSTGEECQSLAKYFPDAEIVGVDINASNLYTARRNNKNPNIHFTDEINVTGKFDVVFAMMVLFCMDRPIPWERFEQTLVAIDRRLKRGGLLVAYTTEFALTTSEMIGNRYRPVREWERTHNKNNKIYYNGYYRKKWLWELGI